MASILALLGGLWFAGAAILNVSGGDELVSFPRVIYVGLALIAFALVDWGALLDEGPSVSLRGHDAEHADDD